MSMHTHYFRVNQVGSISNKVYFWLVERVPIYEGKKKKKKKKKKNKNKFIFLN